MVNNINFIPNNVKGFQCNNKRLKVIEYFKDRIVSNGFLFFLHETYFFFMSVMKLSGKMILTVKSVTRMLNVTHVVV